MARWLATAALLVAAALLSLALAEVAVRWLLPQQLEPHPRGLYRADPELGHVLAPHVDGVSRSPEWEVPVRTNALGLRDIELGPKAPGEWRLLVLGDSFTFGAGVRAEATWPRLLERELRAAGYSRLRVVNAGVPAYGVLQEALLFERLAPQVEPDAVLLGFFLGNDFYDRLEPGAVAVVDGYLVSAPAPGSFTQIGQRLGLTPELKIALRTRSHLYTLSMHAWSALLARTGLGETGEAFAIYRRTPPPEIDRALEEVGVALARLEAACRRRGIPLAVAALPDQRVENPVTADPSLDYRAPVDHLRRLAEPLGLALFDLSDSFRGRADAIFAVDQHWNEQGHELAARFLARELIVGDSNLLPTSHVRGSPQ